MGPHNNFFRKKSCFLNNLSLDLIYVQIDAMWLVYFEEEIASVHCQEEGCIGSNIPDDQEISKREILRVQAGPT